MDALTPMDMRTKVSDTGKLNLPVRLRRQIGLDRSGPVAVRAALLSGAPLAAKLSPGGLLCLALAQRAGLAVEILR